MLFRRLFFLLLFLLPTQFGRHIWLTESIVLGRKIDYLSPTLYLTDIIFLLLLGVAVHQKTIRIPPKPFFIIGIISAFLLIMSPSFFTTYFIIRGLEFFLFIFLIISYKPSLSEIWKPLAFSVVLQVGLVIAQFLSQHSMGGVFYFLGERALGFDTPGVAKLEALGRLFLRPYGTFSHPNVLGGFLAICLPFFLFPIVKKKEEYLLRNIALWASFVGIFLSFSRIAWIATVWISLVYLHTKINKNYRKLVWIGILCVVVFEELTFGRLGSVFVSRSDTVTERVQLQQGALAMFFDSPILGNGVGRFIPLLPAYSSPPYLLQPVHSIYLLILAETGLVGFGVVMFFVVKTVIRGLTKKHYVYLVSLSAILFLGLFDHYPVTLPQTQWVVALIVGILWS